MLEKIQRKLKNIINNTPLSEQVAISPKSIYYGHQKITYKGVAAIRCPFDYVIFQMLIFEVKPDLIIEIGTNKGGSTLYLSDLMQLFNLTGEIHAIDVNDFAVESLKNDSRIKLFTNGWESYDLKLTDGFNKILIIEDASHSYECTLGVLQKFGPIVSKDSYLIVEDGIVTELNMEKQLNGGPLKAIREFLPLNSEFVVDSKWCDMFGKNATFNVNGYLKRVR
jgi:cephalosporin hydroxylase